LVVINQDILTYDYEKPDDRLHVSHRVLFLYVNLRDWLTSSDLLPKAPGNNPRGFGQYVKVLVYPSV
jgi:hypothetical protein